MTRPSIGRSQGQYTLNRTSNTLFNTISEGKHDVVATSVAALGIPGVLCCQSHLAYYAILQLYRWVWTDCVNIDNR